MSKENLEQFMNQVAESKELQARIGDEIDAKSLIALGAECGCEFTAEELQESVELSDEELDGVSGGFSTSRFGSGFTACEGSILIRGTGGSVLMCTQMRPVGRAVDGVERPPLS